MKATLQLEDKRLLARDKPQARQLLSYLLRGNQICILSPPRASASPGPLWLLPVKPECRVHPLKQPHVTLLRQTYKKPMLRSAMNVKEDEEFKFEFSDVRDEDKMLRRAIDKEEQEDEVRVEEVKVIIKKKESEV